MADFETAVKIVLKHEGGYVDHPNDPGGATNMGIIFKLFKKYAHELNLEPTINTLKTLRENEAKYIYKKEFWDQMKGDDIINQQVANIIFDAYVNMGPRALKMLQTEIGVKVDGVIGNNTLQVINQAAGSIVFEGFKEARQKFYYDLAERKPSMKVFLKGWLNRINSFNYQYT